MITSENEVQYVGHFEKIAVKDLDPDACSEYMWLEPHRDSGWVRVYPESLVVHGDMDLDYQNYASDADYVGIIVQGDLTVKGNIVNTCLDFGIYLEVHGTTLANNLIARGSFMDFHNAIIKHCCVALYNHGSLAISRLSTKLLLDSEHDTTICDTKNVSVSIGESDGQIVLDEYELAKFWYQHGHMSDVCEFDGENLDDFDECREFFHINANDIINKILCNEEQDLLNHVDLFVVEAKKRANDLNVTPVNYGGLQVTWKNGLATEVFVSSTDGWLSFSKAVKKSPPHDLTRLEVSSLEAEDWSLILRKLPHLTDLALEWVELEEFPSAIRELKHLTNLDLNSNNIEVIPPWIGSLQSLRQLDLENNDVTKISSNIAQLKQLDVLNLRENSLKSLPTEIGELVQLQRLDLGDNKITKLPESMEDLRKLTELKLDNNPIEKISDALKTLPNLKILEPRKNYKASRLP